MPNTPLVEEWFAAIDCDDEVFVKEMLEKNVSLLEEKFEGAQYDEEIEDLAHSLLGKDIGGLNAIQYAAFVESEDSALVLVEYCDDAMLSQKWGKENNTIFHMAAFNGMESLLKALLRRRLPSTLKNRLGFRPVDCVANDATRDVFAHFDEDEEPHEGVKESKKKMLDRKEPLKPSKPVQEVPDDDDSEYEIPEYPPLRKIDPKAKPKKSSIPSGKKQKKGKVSFEKEVTFSDACRNGELDLVKHYIEVEKMSIQYKTYLGVTVLHMGVESGNLDLVKYLLSKGCPLDSVDLDGYSPFLLACSMDFLEIAKFLAEKGADINRHTKEEEYAIELTEDDQIVNYIKSLPRFDRKILDIVASRPPKDDEEDDPKARKRD